MPLFGKNSVSTVICPDVINFYQNNKKGKSYEHEREVSPD